MHFSIRGTLSRLTANSYVLLALALALVAAAPFLTRPGLPHQTDAELHVYRAAELGHTLRAGVFYPRWAPDFYYGYGYPIFNYYAPLTYYLANLFDLWPGVDIVGGVKAVFVLGLLVASLGTYLLGRALFGPAAGVLAAASFTFAPYVVFIDPHGRGDLAEHFALCLLPLAFYAFHSLMSGVGGRGALLGSVLSLAAIVFSHNLLGLVASGLLLVYWVWMGVVVGVRPSGFRKTRRVWETRRVWGGLVFVLAAAIIAFFWLPFLLERDAIRLDVVGPGHFDFREHFLAPGELLASSRSLDLGATAPHYRFNLGLAQWLLALPALVVFLRLAARRTPNQVPPTPPHSHTLLLYFVLASLGLIFLMLPVSTAVWQCVPGLVYLQFPWRLLGPANLMLALCAAGGTTLLPAGRWRSPVLAMGLATILLLALPALYPPMWAPDFGPTTVQDILQWEQHSLALGTTSTGDFVPVEAALVPLHPEPALIESYSWPGPVDKVNRASLPGGASVNIVSHGPLHDRFAVSTSKKFVLRLYTFYFPGWRAYVDGEEVEIEVAGPEGFITLRVPEGEHEVLVCFEDTPPRTAGWIISAIGLAMLIVALLLMRTTLPHSHTPLPHSHTPLPRSHTPTLPTLSSPLFWLGGALLSFVILKGALIDPQDGWLRYTSPPGQAWAAQHEQWAGFYADGGGQIELLGYDLPRQRIRSGDQFSVVLYWHALAPLDVNYQSFVHLARPLQVVWGQDDHLNPGGLPTTRWPLDRYVWDEYEVHILPGTPPGEYALNVGLYSMAGGYRLWRYDERGQAVGDSLVLAPVEVQRPRRQPRLAELDMTREVMAAFPEGGLTLLGYAQPCDQVRLPSDWRITLFWRADRDSPAARLRDLVLLDAEGHEVWRLSGAPVDGHYPFEVWRADEIVRDPLLFIPAQPVTLKPGVYRFGVTVSADEPLIAEGASEPFVFLGSVEFLVEE